MDGSKTKGFGGKMFKKRVVDFTIIPLCPNVEESEELKTIEIIKNYSSRGYELWGNPYCAKDPNSNNVIHYQAMIKRA
jgi:hypothetical protein